MFERPQQGEHAILVHVTFRHFPSDADLPEFRELARAAGALVDAEILGLRDKPDPKFYIGQGKLAELLDVVQHHKAQVVLFNHELSPSQERNIERAIKCRVLSRTGLILDIFAQRARTYEGKLQVELAQLNHMATRLVRGWTHLERQKGGIGLRGPGETQLEVDRRLLRKRILTIRKRLEKVKEQREQNRHSRQKGEVPTIALVGYTNAGKSTLFNALTGAEVWVADQLFATLDPTIRALKVPGVGETVLVDTVGFVQQLPHTLVEAFRATLEETCQATLLLHVIDAHNPHWEEHTEEVNAVLTEIGAEEIPQLWVLNKADLLPTEAYPADRIMRDAHGQITKIWVSALTGQGLDLLQTVLQSRLSVASISGELVLRSDQGDIRSQLFELQSVLNESLLPEGGWKLVIKLTHIRWQRLCQEHSGLAEAFSALE